jgi:hypothetical protein
MRVSLSLVSVPLAVATAIAACSSFKDDPICTSDSCADAALDDAPSVDAGGTDVTLDEGAGDAPAPPDAAHLGFTPTTLAQSINVATQTGHAQQRHLVYAARVGRFFLFYLDEAAQTSLKVRSSGDFVTWRQEQSLTLPDRHANEGRNFSVATRVVRGFDVFHVILALHSVPVERDAQVEQDAQAEQDAQVEGGAQGKWDVHRTYHARARVTNGTLGWSGLSLLTNLNAQLGSAPILQCDPDGPDVTISVTGVVADITGWQASPDSQCDANVFVSPNVDTGGPTWAPSFPSYPAFHMQNENTSNVHSLTSLPTGDIVALFGNGGERLAPTNIAWSRSLAGGIDDAGADADDEARTWPSGRDVFPASATQPRNDWTQCVLGDGVVHAVRRVVEESDAFEHQRNDGTGWIAGGVVPPASGGRGRGIVLVSRGNLMKMFKLGDDGSVESLAWDGTAWEPEWETAVAGGKERHWLSGTGCGSEPAVLWTEGAPGFERVVAMRVRF